MNVMRIRSLAFVITLLLVSAVPALAETGSWNAGIEGGPAWGLGSEALENYINYNNEDLSWVYGGDISYRFPNGFAIGLGAKNFHVNVTKTNLDFPFDPTGTGLVARVDMTPVMVLFKWQGMPKGGTGLTAHVGGGVGISFNTIKGGEFLTHLRTVAGFPAGTAADKLKVDDTFVLQGNAGLDYFFSKHFSTNLDGNIMYVPEMKSTGWNGVNAYYAGTPEQMHIKATTFQLMLGMRYWFK